MVRKKYLEFYNPIMVRKTEQQLYLSIHSLHSYRQNFYLLIVDNATLTVVFAF